MAYLCANFSLPKPVSSDCSRLRPDVRDRQTDVRQTNVRQHHRLMPPPIRGGRITIWTHNVLIYHAHTHTRTKKRKQQNCTKSQREIDIVNIPASGFTTLKHSTRLNVALYLFAYICSKFKVCFILTKFGLHFISSTDALWFNKLADELHLPVS